MKKKATARAAKANSRQSTLNFSTSSEAELVAESTAAETSMKSGAKNRRKRTADFADDADKHNKSHCDSSAISAIFAPSAVNTTSRSEGQSISAERSSWSNLPLSDLVHSIDQGWSPRCENYAASNHSEWAVIKTTAIQNLQFLDQENKALPPLSEQHRIVAEIEKQFTPLDAGVAALKRVQANLKRYRAAVLKAACEGKLVPTEAELKRTADIADKEMQPSASSAKSAVKTPSFEPGDQLLQRILNERRQNWQGLGKYKAPFAPDNARVGNLPAGWTWATLDQLTSRPAQSPKQSIWDQVEGSWQGDPLAREDQGEYANTTPTSKAYEGKSI